jgi:prolyl oligopeptidase
VVYPEAPRLDVVQDVHGTAVPDPYRWLEDPAHPGTRAWATAQDTLAQDWLAALPGREALRQRLRQVTPGSVGAPQVIGSRRFWTARAPGANHAAIWVADGAGERILVDPNVLDPEGTITLDGWSPSMEGERLAYLLSSGGDEESALWILDVASGERLDGPIDRARYSSLAWLPGGERLYFVRRLGPGEVPAGEEQFHRRLWLHRVGGPADEDVLVFGQDQPATAYLGCSTSEDGRWLAVSSALGTAPRNDLWLADLHGAGGEAAPVFVPVTVGEDAKTGGQVAADGQLWLWTDRDAPRGRVCAADPEQPGTDGWQTVVGEPADGAVLEGFTLAGPYVVVLERLHAISRLYVHDRAGRRLGEVALPGAGSATLTGRPDEGPEVWVGYTDNTTPYEVFHLDLSGPPSVGAADALPALAPWAAAPGRVPPVHRLASYQVCCLSADGTPVRITLTHRADLDPSSGPHPTVLYGYGGFAVSLEPGYSATVLAWAEAGGVWAVAHLRGGSEEGEDWHRDGMREHKHHVFEDFEAAADWLVAEGWADIDHLGIFGGSNGGLLVGVALTRRPAGYRAVVCSAPLLDMVRYEQFGLGATWNDEFGTVEDPREAAWLLSYSPYHHVEPGRRYPAVLFTVFDSDTRVDPLHARKMCAALQAATAAPFDERPVLLRREADVGHGARSVDRTVGLVADELGFLGACLGLSLPGA